MRDTAIVLIVLAALLPPAALPASAGEAHRPGPASTPRALPPLPPGVADLRFGEFFVFPVGDRGLTLTPKLRGLHGKRVRVLGHMVRQEEPSPGVLLLTATPLQLHEHEYGLADDLPPATVRVFVPAARGKPVPFTPGPLLLTGTLSVGNRSEPDGRVSLVRLTLDPQTAAVPQTASVPPAPGKRAPVPARIDSEAPAPPRGRTTRK